MDKKIDKIGVLDCSGNDAIPAEYNFLTNVQNGYMMSLKGALKKNDTHNNGWQSLHLDWRIGTTY